jgi:hypothetical protein
VNHVNPTEYNITPKGGAKFFHRKDPTATDCRQCGKPFHVKNNDCEVHRRQGNHFIYFVLSLFVICALLVVAVGSILYEAFNRYGDTTEGVAVIVSILAAGLLAGATVVEELVGAAMLIAGFVAAAMIQVF